MMRRLAALVLALPPLAGACGGDAGAPPDLALPDAATIPDLTPPPDLAPIPVVRFVAVGDTGRGNQGQYDVAAAIEDKCARDGCDFVQLLGDNIYDTGVSSTMDPQWQDKFEKPYQMIELPFFVVLGNHDYGGWGGGWEFGKGQFQVDYSQVSSKWKLPAAYWHRADKHVEFFGLDTNMQMYYHDIEQRKDVRAWVTASQATWRIAFGHHPYLSNGNHGNAGTYDGSPFVPITNGLNVKSFMDEVICGDVDLYISGHDHSRQWLRAGCDGTELVVSGAGCEGTPVTDRNASWFQAGTMGFLYVVITGNQLVGEFVDVNGTTEFTRTLMK